MKYYNIDRDIAKKLFLRLTFFGTHNGFLKELKINTNTKPLTFITDFINELKHIAGLFKDKNKQLYDTARRQNTTNTLGSFFSMYLQEYETRIMSCVIQWLNDKTDVTTYKNCKNKVLTYEFDGVKLLKENVDKYGIGKLKKDMEKVIFDELGFNMVFEEKPIEKCYDIEYIPFEHQEIKQVVDKQTLLEQQEYFYDDYQQFIGLVLSKNNEPTKDGLLFKRYYKQVFARVDCGGNTKYFSKSRNDGFIQWILLPSIPFGEKLSSFNYFDKIETPKGIIDKKYPINIFIGNLNKDDMTIFSNVDFIPYLHEGCVDTDIFNLFTGFKYKPLLEEVENKYYDDIKPILSHVKEVLCADNQGVYAYVLNWLAHLIQRPCDKAGVPVILMKSEQGAGKNLFWDFMGRVMGNKYIVTINDLDDLTNKFNTRTEGKLLTILNEIQNYGGNFKNNEKLKSILTDITQTIEPKGKESYTINNFSRSIMLTNNDWATKISNDDRRYLPIDVSNHRKGDNEYFKNLANVINNDKNAEVFFHFLSQMDISDFDIREIPHTQLKENMKWFNTENRPLYFLKEYIVDLNESDEPITKFSSQDLFKEYCLWCENNKERQTFSQRTFTQQLNKYGLTCSKFRIDNTQQRGFVITIQDLKVCIEKTLRIEKYNFDD
jgi:putative DNA primase/helicase